MRTDSVTLSQEAIAAAREAVSRHFGEKYLSDAPKQYATKTAGAQEAHECIRPAGAHFRDPAEIATKVPADQLKLYTLIWQRTLACQMADATGSTATVRLSSPTEADGEAMFQASGTVIEFPGFMKATGEGRRSVADAKKSAEAAGVKIGDKAEKSAKASKKTDDNVSLPPMQPGDELAAVDVAADGHETSRRRATPKRRSSKRWNRRKSAVRPRMRASSPQSSTAGTCTSVAVR